MAKHIGIVACSAEGAALCYGTICIEGEEFLGTSYLMEGPVYSEKLTEMGINFKIPEKEDRERINDIIFNELVYGKFYQKSH